MIKRIIIAAIVVFILWSGIDFVVHGIILQKPYQQTANLWRPMEEFNIPLMYLITFIVAAGFVLIYALLIKPKSIAKGLSLGILLGLIWGIAMGFGSYTYMPITLDIAVVWSVNMLIEMTLAGLITAAIVK